MNWEKEFDKEFTRDDGLINKYSWYGTGEEAFAPQPMPDAIKQFIKNLLAQKDKEMKEKFKKEVEKINGYNSAVSELNKNIENKKKKYN